MATISRNRRRKARLKRNNSLLRRALGTESKKSNLSISTLFMVLAQQGGEVTLSKGTVLSVTQDVSKLSYAIDKGKEEGEFTVRLVVRQDEPVVTSDGGAVPDAHLGAVDSE